MSKPELDPAFKNARREAVILMTVFAVALTYTLSYCHLFGYGRDVSEIVSYFGIPDWVWWGIFVPWTVCVPVTVWFCFSYMTDDDLDPDEDSSSAS